MDGSSTTTIGGSYIGMWKLTKVISLPVMRGRSNSNSVFVDKGFTNQNSSAMTFAWWAFHGCQRSVIKSFIFPRLSFFKILHICMRISLHYPQVHASWTEGICWVELDMGFWWGEWIRGRVVGTILEALSVDHRPTDRSFLAGSCLGLSRAERPSVSWTKVLETLCLQQPKEMFNINKLCKNVHKATSTKVLTSQANTTRKRDKT